MEILPKDIEIFLKFAEFMNDKKIVFKIKIKKY